MTDPVSARERAPLALLGLLTVCLVLVARTLHLPPGIRAGAGLVAVLILPGAALALLWPGISRHGWPAVLALSFPLSLVPVLGASVFATVLGWKLLPLGAAYLFGTFAVALVSLVLARRREAPDPSPPGARRALAALLIGAAALLAVSGAPTGPETDGPDHEATVNAILQGRGLFPSDVLAPAGEIGRPDPRKGVFHVGLALAASVGNVDASRVWTEAPAVLAVSWLCLVFVLGIRLGLGGWGAFLAALLALLYTGGEGGRWAARLGYGAHAGLLTAWAGTWVLLGLLREFERPGVLLLAVLTAVAAAVHPMAPAFLFLPAILLALTPRGDAGTGFLRTAGALATALAVAAPVLVWRFLEVRGPVNPLHREVMPVLELGRGGSVLWPPEVWNVLGPVGTAGLLLALAAPRFHPDRWGRRYLAAAGAASVAVALVPGLFDAGAAAASSLPVKLLYLTPFCWALAALWEKRWKGARLALQVPAALLALAALPAAVAGFAPARTAGWRPPEAEAAIRLLHRAPGPGTVAADPWMSSLVAAETSHRPVTVYHQHGNPLDPGGLSRLNDLEAILSPWTPPEETGRLLRGHHVAYVLVPDAASGKLRTGFGAARGGALSEMRYRKFARRPRDFPPVARGPGWALFRVADPGAGPAPEPLLPAPAGTPRGWRVDPADGSAEGVRLSALEFPDSVRAGDAVPAVLWWRRDPEATGWPVEVHLRLVAAGAGEGSKLARLLRERIPGRREARRRDREVLAPFLGAWPATSWPARVDLADSVRIAVPGDLAPGRYRVSVRVLPRPMFLRVSLHDLLSENDRWQGKALAVVRVAGTEPGPRR